MVRIQVKRTEERNAFLYDTSVSCSIDTIIKEVVDIHNLRLKVLRLCDACRGLAAHGPLRPEESRGLSDEVAKMSNLDISDSSGGSDGMVKPDPTNYRTGRTVSAELCEVLNRSADESETAVSHQKVSLKTPLTLKGVTDSFDVLKGAVMIAYPGNHNLPPYDYTRLVLDDQEDVEGTSLGKEILDPLTASMWWSGKECRREKLLSDYVGKNEKTTIIVRFQHAASGPPVREPRIDKDTHAAMLSYYHKQNEIQKNLEADEDDSYLNAEWANPRGLKSALTSAGRGIHWKAGR